MGFDLVSERPSDGTPRCPMYDPADRREYFRSNGAGMAAVCIALHLRDALDELEVPEFPDMPEPEEVHFDDDLQPLTDEAREFARAEEQILRFHRGNGKVPWYKFDTNSEWLVTPEECLIVAGVMASLTPKDAAEVQSQLSTRGGRAGVVFTPEQSGETLEHLTQFGLFAESCARLGGFRVC